MKVYKVWEEHCLGFAIVSANSRIEAINMIDGELSTDIYRYMKDDIQLSYKAELIEDLVGLNKDPKIIACFIDY